MRMAEPNSRKSAVAAIAAGAAPAQPPGHHTSPDKDTFGLEPAYRDIARAQELPVFGSSTSDPSGSL